jgi:hypothetical protein
VSLKNLTISLCLGVAGLTQVSANVPYSFPAHKDVSLNNYDNTGFSVGKEAFRFSTKSEITVGSTIMAHDRYQRIFNKVGNDYKYHTMIARLDRIEVLSLNKSDDNPYILVKVVSSVDRRLVGKEFYTQVEGLSEYEDYKDFDADVYMVQNIATEKLRVYQRVCKDNSCPPKMIFETDFVSGEKKGDDDFKKNTHVGNYRIFEWEKFYQDQGTGGHYPSWFDPSFPEAPSIEDSWSAWFDKDIMPWEFCETKDGKEKCSHKGMMRGAFGWFTALVEPHYGTGQWTHGTIGWAESSIENIYRAKGEDTLGALANIFSSLRSSGCSRVSNPSVAFLRHILPVGTPLIKIYALEAYQDQASMESNYEVGATSTWDFMLTKDGVRKTGLKATSAHRNYVERAGLNTFDNILEEGTYEFRTYPTVVQYQYKPRSSGEGYRRSKGCVEDTVDNYPNATQIADGRSVYDIDNEKDINKKQCNVYKIPSEAFQGRFYVDTGLVEGYDHPQAKGVIRGGFRSQKYPDFFALKNYK